MIPEPQRSRLAMLQSGLEGARWVRPEKLHLTVRFIGEVDEPTARDVEDTLGRLMVPGFDIYLSGIGVFDPGNRPRSLWEGVKDATPLAALHEKCNQALRSLNVMEERRKYMPHVSLARLVNVDPTNLGYFLEGNSLFDAPPFRPQGFSLIRSYLTKHGAAYEILNEFEFTP